MSTPLDLNALAAASIHELKNLLGSLTLSLDEIAAAGCPGADGQVAAARFACRRISDRLVEMLTLYKLEGGHLTPTIDAHSPADFLADLAHEAQALAAGNLNVAVDGKAAPPFWFFDRDLVQSAMMNGLHNAIAHARGLIRLTARREGEWLRLEVCDDGPGFPAEVLAGALTAPGGSRRGTGLGLYFAQRVAQAHANEGRCGRVEIANARTGGAAFSLLLP